MPTKDEREALQHATTSASLLAEEAGKVAAFIEAQQAELAALASRPIAPGKTVTQHLNELAAEGDAIVVRVREAQARYAKITAAVASSQPTGRQ